MAHLRDVVPAVRSLGLVKFVVILIRKIARDRLATEAAAMAYAWLFAIFPFVLFLLTLFAYIPEKQKVEPRKLIDDSLRRILAHDAAETIITNLHEVLNEPRSGLLSFGLIATLWIASGGISVTMTALDSVYDVKKSWPFYLQRLVAMLLTMVVTVLIVVVFLLLPVGTAVEDWLADNWNLPARSLFIITVSRYFIAFLLLHCVLVLLYTFGMRVRRRLIFFSPGALFTLLVWFALQAIFRFYVERFGRYQKTYGAIGGVTIVLLFFFLDSFVLLIGAELNNQIDRTMKERSAGQSVAKST